ncbi:MAG: N-glycosylase/DNA lyase [Candidatus Heimdallarchaeota archaeon]
MHIILDKYYEQCKYELKERLLTFKQIKHESEEKIFAELCYCLCTPQSKAQNCAQAIKSLEESGTLYSGTWQEIQQKLKGVRFAPTKAKRIVAAREYFTENGRLVLKKHLDTCEDMLRGWLVKNVKGLGYKEASHFLRNIGLSETLAILDRHVLKNLKKFGIIKEIPANLSKKKYFEIEQKMQDFCQQINISLAKLDLIFWSMETGKILK